MGTWGPGNFESDQALDLVGDFCREFEREISQAASKRNLGIDDFLNDVMPRIAVLAVLVDHCLRIGPRVTVVRGWRERFIGLYDRGIDKLAPAEDFKAERRARILETFASLETHAIPDEDFPP